MNSAIFSICADMVSLDVFLVLKPDEPQSTRRFRRSSKLACHHRRQTMRAQWQKHGSFVVWACTQLRKRRTSHMA
jgi:hypothetical protein